MVNALSALVIIVVLFSFGIGIRTREQESKPLKVEEVRFKDIHLRSFRSSENPQLLLWALIHLPVQKSCILVTTRGWHGSIYVPEKNEIPKEHLLVEVSMRGRFFSGGRPDCSGWELQDWIDAVEFVRKEYAEDIEDPQCVYADGGSGAGGNTYAIVGKFPDFFASAAVHAGMSDYGLLYDQDEIDEFRDDMEGDAWIGGSPLTNKEGYASRGGMTTIGNLLTPVHIDHGETDIRVSVEHARRYVNEARRLARTVKYIEWRQVGDRRHWTGITKAQEKSLLKSVREWFLKYKTPPLLPKTGSLTVAGYVKTKYFEVILDHIDRIGRVDYKLSEERVPEYFRIKAPTSAKVILRVKGFPGIEKNKFLTTAKKSDYQSDWIQDKGYLQIEFKSRKKDIDIRFI